MRIIFWGALALAFSLHPAIADQAVRIPASVPETLGESPSATDDFQDLGDALSPAELEAELAADPAAEFAPAAEENPATLSAPRLVVVVNKSKQRLSLFEDGKLTGSWLVSTGTETRRCAPTGRCYRATTPVGSFRPYRMHHKYTSRLWQARMDRAIFIVGGIALHATYGDNVKKLGSRQSGGCIRQAPENADRLFRLVKQYGMNNTLVKVEN